MGSPDNAFVIFMSGVATRIGPADEREWAYHESLIRDDYERCHPDDTLQELKHRTRFSKEDKGLLHDWMTVAAQRAAAAAEAEAASPPLAAA